MAFTPEEMEQKKREREARESSIASELEEMDSIWTDSEPVKEESVAETQEPVVETPVISTPVEQEVIETETKVDVEAEPEEDEYAIGEMINQLAREAMQKQVVEQPTQEVPASPTQQPVATQVQAQTQPEQVPQSIVTIEEMSEAFNSPEKFVEILNRVYTAGISAASERALLQLPQVARQVSIQVASQAEMHRKFYEEHQELSNYKDFVAYCASQVEAKHPDWEHKRILEETARVAKSRLPALRRAKRDAQGKPALPGSGKAGVRNRPTSQAITALEQEINDMPDRF